VLGVQVLQVLFLVFTAVWVPRLAILGFLVAVAVAVRLLTLSLPNLAVQGVDLGLVTL
jgi:hypothetical protein